MEFFQLIIAAVVFALGCWLAFIVGKLVERLKWKEKVKDIRKESVERSRAVLTGKFSEQLAPYLPDFNYSPTEARFVGKPVDFIVFKGLDSKEPEEVVFVEVKSGKSQLSTPERKLRDVIRDKKVRWELYRIPEDLNKRE